jgi:uncharacterized membrane protein
MNASKLMLLGVAMIFIGFIVVAAGALTGTGGSGSTGGFILIGPIPIFFGSGPESGTLAVLGVVITVVMLAVYIFAFLGSRSRRRGEVGTKSE